MYGPKSGSLIASIPGLPPPPPGFPPPAPEPLLYPEPEPEPLEPEPDASFEPEPLPTGASEGLGENEPPPFEPPFLDEPEPLIGPVAYCPALVPPGGTGTLKGDDVGFEIVFGVIGGRTEGLVVGG